ncbi:hypothetical protein AVEN_243669-1 [Araneus ventricosus]|uniref:Uncharacterized protein n=1 Tax=Araneus ventricosus TaxID=182803 RepID=A0A4Y2A559_ARAVE|nr:hypothetical protein AVEN_243669-1 [Araneus ventricosus]
MVEWIVRYVNKFYDHKIGLITLTSLFEATQGLFWDEPCNFERQSEDEDNTELAPQSSAPAQRAKARSPMYNLTCNKSYTRRTFSGIRIQTWIPLTPKPRPCH